MTGMSSSEWENLGFKLGSVFKPATPINREDLFSGRIEQTRKVVDAINQPGCHAMIYGERGVGKTSLANMLFPKLTSTGCPILIPHINCLHNDSFSSVWKRVFEELEFKHDHIPEEYPDGVIEILQKRNSILQDIQTDDVRRVVHLLGADFLLVIVIDEFDSIDDPDTRHTMAHTVKFLSDRNEPVTIVLIGVADDIDDLISDHRSVERCMSQVALPRMSRDELEAVVLNGLRTIGMKIDTSALHEISRLSRGLPHYAHLFGLHAGRAAVDRFSKTVSEADVKSATKTALGDVQASIKSDYNKAITSARADAKYREVLLAAALADSDELGFFYPKDVRPALSRILGENSTIDKFARHLNAFCDNKRGGVLYKDEKTDRPRYRFDNPLLQPYVLMRGLHEGLLTEDDLKSTKKKDDPRLF